MTSSTPLSPRREALNAILHVRQSYPNANLDEGTWDKIVTLSWESRTLSGDRRELQRALRAVLLEASRDGGGGDATA